MLKAVVIGVVAALALSACEPEATPLPIDVAPTSAPTALPSAAVQPIRYAIDASTLPFIPPDDYNLIAAASDIQIISPPFATTDLGTVYDMLITFGDLSGATRAPELITVSLAMNTSLPPLDDAALAALMRRRINPSELVAALGITGVEALPHQSDSPQTLRTELANLGLPDGFDLSLAGFYAPGIDALAAQLASITVGGRITQITAETDLARFHLILFNRQAIARIPSPAAENVLDLVTIPLSYHAVPEMTISFTDGGFPLAAR